MSIATALIDATVDAVRETDRQLLDAMKRAVLFDTTAMQQWYDQRDYDAMRRSLMVGAYTSFTDISPTGDVLPQTDIYFPLTTATGTYRATGTITINKDLAQGLLKAVETLMLKVGDRVKILRPFTEEEKRKPPHWTPGMEPLVGAEGVVDHIGNYVSVKVGKSSYSWLPETLELVPAADEIAFGPFPSKEEIIAVRADFTYAPVWEAKSPTGELSFVRCYPNIGDVDTFASFRDTTYKKSEKFPAFADYSARPLDKDGKPFARKHLALTTGATPPSPDITMYINGKATTFPTTATAAQVAEKLKTQGVEGAAAPQSKEEVQAALDGLVAAFNKHTNNVAPLSPPVPPSTRDTDARAAERLAQVAQTAKKEQWRGFPTMEEVREEPFTVWAFQRPDSFVFYGYFVIAVTNPGQQYIYLQRCSDKGVFQFGAVGPPFTELQELKARRAIECPTDTKCGAYVSTVEQGLGEVVGTRRRRFTEPGDVNRDSMGAPICDVRFGDKTVAVPLRDLKLEHKNFAEKIAAQVESRAAEARRDPLVQDVKLICKAIPAKEGFAASQIHHEVAYTTAHDVAEVRGTSDRPLGEVLQRQDTLIADDFEVDSQGNSPLKHEDFGARLAALQRRLAAEAAAKEALTSATTSATIPEQLGATMPTTDKPTSRMRRAITEATRRAPVELGLNQAHEAIVKQAARKFKGTAAEKKVVARFLTDLLGSEYGKAGLAAALATVIPQLAPLLGKHEGKADVLAEELATRSATILAVKAGSDLISLLGPLTAILSEMISSAEPPQITAGSGRSALDEINVTAAPVAATAKR